MDIEKTNIVERIQGLCDENGTNFNALETEVGLGRSSIRFWDKYPPAITKVMKVAKHFGVSLDYIVGLSDDDDSKLRELKKLDLSPEELSFVIDAVEKIRSMRNK